MKYIEIKISKSKVVQFPKVMVEGLKSKADFEKMFPHIDSDICWPVIKKANK